MFHSNFINHQQCLANGGFLKVFLFVARWSRGMPILVIVEKGQDVSFLLELSPTAFTESLLSERLCVSGSLV